MAEINPFDRTDVLRRDAWDDGFAAGEAAMRGVTAHECGWCGYEQMGPDGMNGHALTCEKGPTAKIVALVQQMLDADAIAEWFMDTDNDGVDVRAALAAIRAGEVRG